MRLAKLRQQAVDAVKTVTPIKARRWLVRVRLRLRLVTAPARLLPDFIVLGGQRCGTSSLYKYLGRHPEIAPSLRKEIEYFTIDYGRGEAWYRAHFPLRMRRRLAAIRSKRLLTFEATPDYLVDPRAPQRVASLVPHARFIVMLREPVSRAYSHYRHMVRLGFEDLDFPQAIDAEPERLAPDLEAMWHDPDNRAYAFRRYSYSLRGLYADQLERWFEHFPREQFLILTSDDFFANTEKTLHRILAFVGASQWSPPEFRNYSYVQQPESDEPELPERAAEQLQERFSGPNRELRGLLGMDLPWDTP